MCKLCETKPVYEFTNQRRLCKSCFIRWFQKKVLYTNRKFEMMKKGDVVGYLKGNSFRGTVLEDVLKMIGDKGFVEVVRLSNKKVSKIAVSDTTDVVAEEVIDKIVNGDIKKIKALPVEGNVIKPLYLFLDKEVLLYAKLKKLKFKVVKEKEEEISKFIDELEVKHPEVKQAIVGGYLGSCFVDN